MVKLFGRASSINVRKVLWTCEELGLPIEHAYPETDALDMLSPSFLARNPNAKVPVLQDGDFVLWESNSICRYLAGRAGRDDLLPTDPRRRARVEQWMDWQAGDLNNAWRYAFLSLVRKSSSHRDPQAAAHSAAEWNRHMTILDGQLAKTGAFVTGPVFTLADVVLGVSAYRWTMTPVERPDLPEVARWMGLLGQRAPYRAHGGNGKP